VSVRETDTFQIGDRVERIEDRISIGATVISINEDDIASAPQIVEILYDEGGFRMVAVFVFASTIVESICVSQTNDIRL